MKLPLADGATVITDSFCQKVILDLSRGSNRLIASLTWQEASSLAEHLLEAAASVTDEKTHEICSVCKRSVLAFLAFGEIHQPGDELVITCMTCIKDRKD